MKKRIISVILSVILIIVAMAPAIVVADAAVWSGSRSVPTYSGGVYKISTGEELAWFANAVNTGSTAIKGELTADIMLNYANSLTRVWTPIGTEASPFRGTFDGKGFTISGLYVNSSVYCSGLFGYVKYTSSAEEENVSPEYITATKDYAIKNINVTNALISGVQNVGGIAGYVYDAGILDCSYSGTVKGTENSVGGIVGWATASSVISECHSTGSVEGHQRVGGTAGFCNGNSVVTKCYGDMNVTGFMNVGGITGTLSSAALRGAYFLGSVSADDVAGGIIGYSAFGDLIGAYAISSVTNTADGTEFGGAIGKDYGGEYKSIYYSYETAGYDGAAGMGRTVEEMRAKGFVKELNHTSPFFCVDYTAINNGYPVLTWMLKLDVWAGDIVMPKKDSSGTYLISKPSELAWFAGLVNGTLSGFDQNTAANARVTDDILFNIDVNDDSMGRTEWTPIGKSTCPYTGTFNGGGYNIAGVYVPPTAGTNGNNTGLFGYVSTGSISTTVLVDGLICGKENVGGIVGYLSGGSVTDCICDSEVQGHRAVGGIVGNLASSTSNVTTCGMIGTVTGTNESTEDASTAINIGGLVGYSNRGVISKSFVSADINAPASKYVGGIIGQNTGGSVSSCYSISTVTGNINVGGLVGYNNNGTVTRCYTVGKVIGKGAAGMICGSNSSTNVNYCYFDESYKSLANTTTNGTGLPSVRMTGWNAYSYMSLYGDFRFVDDDTYFYYYPQISSMSYSSYNAIKNASVESVKRVQDKYTAKVEINGRTQTYYESLEDAFDYAVNTESLVLPTVFLLRDKVLDSTLNISATVPVSFFGENEAVLSRGEGFTGAMINISGDVALGSSMYGDDAEPNLIIDGGSIGATSSAVTVAAGSTLRIQEGVCIKNCTSSTTRVKGAAVSSTDSESSIIMTGGTISSNTSRSVAGGIYVENGTLSISGGLLEKNEGTQGGAVYNNNGTVTISGGTLSENEASGQNYGGGAVAGNGVYSETKISGNAVFTQNRAERGGAVWVRNYGTLEIAGGSLTGNHALRGGAAYIEGGAEAYITGGNIADNVSDMSVGNGIYNDSLLYMSGDARIDISNDVYLTEGNCITVDSRLSCPGNAATITPESYTEGVQVLDGKDMIANYAKFGLSDKTWKILATGKISNAATESVAILSKESAYTIEYINLEDAFAAVGEDETANITLIGNTTVTESIPVNGDVTLSCDDETFTIMRDGSFYGVMFDVQPGAVLHIGDKTTSSSQQAQEDYEEGTETAGQIIIDGGYLNNGVTGGAAINVQSGGQLDMHDDVIIRNCDNTTTGVITVSGTMNMYGGTLCNNNAKYGAIYVKGTGVLNAFGGVITGNTSSQAGDAVYATGKVNRNLHSYDFYYIAEIIEYEEVETETGTEMREVTKLADPEYKFSVKTDILITPDDTVYLSTNKINVAETNEIVFSRNMASLPEPKNLKLNTMTLALKTYTPGSVVVIDTKVDQHYTGFSMRIPEYSIEYNGKLALNRLCLKSTSEYRMNRDNCSLTGIVVSGTTVSNIMQSFENSSTDMSIVTESGEKLYATSYVSTGCKLRLTNSAKEVIDEIYIVGIGDVNGDMLIDGQDAVLVRAVDTGMLNSDNLSPARLLAADVNFDGTVNGSDAETLELCGVFLSTVSQTV